MRVLANLQYDVGMFAHKPITVDVQVHHYDNGRLAITLVSEMDDLPGEFEPFATATVNLPNSPCPENEVWVKNWSENEGMDEWLARKDIIDCECETDVATSGYVLVSRYKLSDTFIKHVADALVRDGQRSRR